MNTKRHVPESNGASNPVRRGIYPNLKLELWKSGVRQNRLAQMIGIHETLLSRIVNGFREPDDVLRARIAHVLCRDESWLFSREDESGESQ